MFNVLPQRIISHITVTAHQEQFCLYISVLIYRRLSSRLWPRCLSLSRFGFCSCTGRRNGWLLETRPSASTSGCRWRSPNQMMWVLVPSFNEINCHYKRDPEPTASPPVINRCWKTKVNVQPFVFKGKIFSVMYSLYEHAVRVPAFLFCCFLYIALLRVDCFWTELLCVWTLFFFTLCRRTRTRRRAKMRNTAQSWRLQRTAPLRGWWTCMVGGESLKGRSRWWSVLFISCWQTPWKFASRAPSWMLMSRGGVKLQRLQLQVCFTVKLQICFVYMSDKKTNWSESFSLSVVVRWQQQPELHRRLVSGETGKQL